MSLLLRIIYRFTLKRITKLQKLHYPPRNSRVGNKSPALFVKQTCCTGDLSPARKIFIERPESSSNKKKILILKMLFFIILDHISTCWIKTSRCVTIYGESSLGIHNRIGRFLVLTQPYPLSWLRTSPHYEASGDICVKNR